MPDLTLRDHLRDAAYWGVWTYDAEATAATRLAAGALAEGVVSVAALEVLATYARWGTSAVLRPCGRTPLENLLAHAHRLGVLEVPVDALMPARRVSRASALPLGPALASA